MAELKRRIGPGLLMAYGIGVMVGAGIYVLVGAVAAQAGVFAPLSFLIAGIIAAPSALAYAELSTRFPEAAGEAAYVESAFGLRWLALLVGLGIVMAGTVSAAAVLRGGAGYLAAFGWVGQDMAVLILGVLIVAVAILGALESLIVAAIFTTIELIGLALVVFAGFSGEVSPDMPIAAFPPVLALGAGATLAFFAFIGFEDIVNLAEEVKRPERSLPFAIVGALIVTSILYALVSFAAVRVVPVGTLAGSEQPLAMVWELGTGHSGRFLSGIAVIAALNGVLAQIVMAARVLFGLGKRTPLLAPFNSAHPRFGTPVLATVVIGAVVLIGAVSLPLTALAGATSVILLVVFVLVNAALITLKRRRPDAPFRVPNWVPWLGLSFALLALGAYLMNGGGH